ncbi:hypothetical protein BKG83_13380 [Mycobacteroides chelonae]|nr:hypothetical protein BKG66_20060 [Mycobacteroides chelonae]OHT69828.1 hypothetical protein BKG67_18610 [Mycobacteroides chelonae]OHT84698.1 hypothetical protein BKG70_18770 [Mycobacteroides chelonae]OHU56295.1 hypothetical protein BKG83_13380 [Mycobacteroides chelonae]
MKDLDAQRSTVVTEPGIPWQLQFTVRTLDGTPFAGASLYGRPAVLWFWAPDRPEAGKQAALIQASAARNSDITFVGIACSRPRAVTEFDGQHQLTFTQIVDPAATIAMRFGIAAQPAYVFITVRAQITTVKKPLGQRDLRTRLIRLATD